ncbi:MAG: sugar phosphate isomerase/epimerase [Lachnospiraceae bacterium]|nr:sugar phosphate isomerase/epimerase [Lachnospiraceae bacterium]
MEFGMPTLIENKTLEDNIALCKQLGLSFVELNMNFPEYQIDKLENIDLFYKKADEAGTYYTIHLDENMNIADFNPLVREAYLETMRRTIEVAKHFVTLKDKYGKNEQPLLLNMHMHHGIYITLPDKKVQMYERDFDVYMEYIALFIKKCEKWIGDADIKIAIENTNGFREYEKRAIERMLDSNCFVLTWDIGHSKALGESDVPFILEHKEKLRHFHIHDGSERPPKNHLALGDGEIDLVERLDMAKACNARCVLETKTIEALKRSVEWLKKAR